jgi:hypothetical protein
MIGQVAGGFLESVLRRDLFRRPVNGGMNATTAR